MEQIISIIGLVAGMIAILSSLVAKISQSAESKQISIRLGNSEIKININDLKEEDLAKIKDLVSENTVNGDDGGRR